MILVGICDDDHALAKLVAKAISAAPDLDVVANCRNGEEALAYPNQVDVWLMDLRMPGLSGRETCRQLMRRAPTIKVLLFTAFGDDLLAETIQAGAAGYLYKDSHPESLQAAIRAAHAGFNVNSPEAVEAGLSSSSFLGIGSALEFAVDDVDKKILHHVLTGASYADIAAAVSLSESGLKKRLTAIMRRTGATSRPQLMAMLHARQRRQLQHRQHRA